MSVGDDNLRRAADDPVMASARNPQSESAHHVDVSVAADLIRQAQSGAPKALGELMRLCFPLVKARAAVLLGSRGDPDDVAQEVFERLLKSVHALREPEGVIAWLMVVTRRTAIEMSRKSAGAVPHAELGDIIASAESTEDEALSRCGRSQARDSIRDALAQLDEADRRLLVLLHRDDRPHYAEVSEVVGRPVGSLGPTRQRLLRRLRHSPALTPLAYSA